MRHLASIELQVRGRVLRQTRCRHLTTSPYGWTYRLRRQARLCLDCGASLGKHEKRG